MRVRAATAAGRALAILALGLAALICGAFPADARDSVILDYVQEAGEGSFTASFTLLGHPDSRLIRLTNPDRVAIDFSQTLPAARIEAPAGDNLIAGMRQGLVAEDRFRVIYHLRRPASADLQTRKTADGEVLSLVLTAGGSATRPDSRVETSSVSSKSIASPTSATEARRMAADPDSPLTIVLDPGHGGIDEGAVSRSGTREKAINLAMAFALRDALTKAGNVDVIMTRDDDTFIPLAERSAIGRRAKADLFISIHADSIRYHDLRGATVYTLSERASDALSRQIAASENAADRFAGEEWQSDQSNVFDILVDLTRRETVSFSEHFAGSLVADLADQGIRLIKRPKRSAGFKVLKAPDMPSVLVELGFLSNRDDEKLLKDEKWRKKVAGAIAEAVVEFFRGKASGPIPTFASRPDEGSGQMSESGNH